MSEETTRTAEEAAETTGQETAGETPNPESMDLDDLGDLINQTRSEPSEEDVPGLTIEEPTVDEPAEETQQAETEPATETTQQQEAESKEEETTDDDPIADLRADMELLRLENQRLGKLLGRQTGEIGHKLQKKIARLEAENRRLREGTQSRSDYSDPEGEHREEATPPQERSDSVTAWAVQQAINTAGAQFRQQYAQEPEVLKEVMARVQRSDFDASSILEADDPDFAMQQTSALLERTYLDVRSERLQQQRAEREQRRVDQAERLKKKKRAAAVSTTGGAPSSPETQRQVNPETMKLEDLGRLIDANPPQPLGSG